MTNVLPCKFSPVAMAFLCFVLFLTRAEARFLLYIDDSATVDFIDVVLVDGLQVSNSPSPPILIGSNDTNVSALWGRPVTASDSNLASGVIEVNSAGLELINAVLGSSGGSFEVLQTFTAYANSVPGPAPSGGERLELKIDIKGNQGASGDRTLTVGVTRSIDFSGPGWFYNHYVSGNADAFVPPGSSKDVENEELITNRLTAFGGVDAEGDDFDLSGSNNNGGAPLTLDPATGSFILNAGDTPFDGTVVGSLTMTLKFTATLRQGDELTYQGFMFATTPEPISIATWGLVGGGMWLTARRRRRRM
jgi:hypothetical protein